MRQGSPALFAGLIAMSVGEEQVDLLVIGSGAGGLLSALVAADHGAKVLVVEKEPLWGGTSATSGGGIWIPASDQAREAGFEDSKEEAFRYVRSLSADNVPDANIRAFVDNAAPMLRWLGEHTGIQYCAFPYPDYHADCGRRPAAIARTCRFRWMGASLART